MPPRWLLLTTGCLRSDCFLLGQISEDLAGIMISGALAEVTAVRGAPHHRLPIDTQQPHACICIIIVIVIAVVVVLVIVIVIVDIVIVVIVIVVIVDIMIVVIATVTAVRPACSRCLCRPKDKRTS